MRVFDFGWALAERTWDDGGLSPMRLQMHATDPQLLEPRLGTANSRGCIRIPARLNRLLDHYGLLDANYKAALARGLHFWVLPRDRQPTPWSGRYLVVVDSERKARPAWSPLPRQRAVSARRASAPARQGTAAALRASACDRYRPAIRPCHTEKRDSDRGSSS